MTSFLTRMPAGIPGDVNRALPATVITEVITPLGTSGHPTSYGIPVALDASTGQIRMIAGGDTLANVYGILVRPFPGFASQDAVGVGTPNDSGACDVLVRGWISVKLAGSTAAAKNGAVYVWKSASGGAHILGSLEAADPTSDGFAITNAFFRGPADANSITEISYNL